MPPKQRRPMISRSRGNDPTVNIANAATARFNQSNEDVQEEIQNEGSQPMQATENKEQKSNDDLKKLIESLKSKMATSNTTQKKAPPSPSAKTPWNRSAGTKTDWAAKPAYTVLSRISNHEKVTVAKQNKSSDMTINEVPHSFLYRPGADGIKVDKLQIKASKQVGMA